LGRIRIVDGAESVRLGGFTLLGRVVTRNASIVLLDDIEVLSASGLAVQIEGTEYLLARSCHFYQDHAPDDVVMFSETKDAVVGTGNGRMTRYVGLRDCVIHGARSQSASVGSGVEMEEGV